MYISPEELSKVYERFIHYANKNGLDYEHALLANISLSETISDMLLEKPDEKYCIYVLEKTSKQ